MKKLMAFIILYSFLWILCTFVILCSSTQAQWYKPYGSYQWEDAQVQRLTYDHFWNWMVGLDIDDNDKLYLFYTEMSVWDSVGHVYRNKLLFMTKESGGEWSQPEVIDTSRKIVYSRSSAVIGVDPKSHVIHIVYSSYPRYNDTLYYTNSNLPDWEFVKIDSLGPEQYQKYFSLAMAFDTLGNVHLVWNVEFSSIGYSWYKVMYANNSTGEWIKQQISPPIWLGYGGSGPSYLAVQKNGTAHIVYNGDVGSDLGFYVRNDSLNSQNWTTDTVPKPSRLLYAYWVEPIAIDTSDKVHLLTEGCIEEDCVWPGMTRTFYYYKQAEDTLWQGPETLPDTTFGARLRIDQLLTDEEGIPYASYFFSSNEVYFTDRRQGVWQKPYRLVGWNGVVGEQLWAEDFRFVLDSQGRGWGAFEGGYLDFMGCVDSIEIFSLTSCSSVQDTLEDQKILNFSLFQNYPNPFNSSTIISYETKKAEKITLKIYDILGREVRQLVNTSQRPGPYKVIWDGKDNNGKEVASGIYFYQLRGGNYKENRKLVLIK
ncbi:MAG: hypothetical protein AMJ73_03755 [candidate division Zixibacteria bacterium SM1_73]|nr:MAG: hypothetical protein AMJ73_03755 [candidate division Zixibacteria bacterium SM1_73]